MKQTLQLRLGQHLTMTPQLQQAIRLLQLSTLDLQKEIQEALESNLMLENEDDESGESPHGSAVSTGDSASRGDEGEHGADRDSEIDDPGATEMASELPVDAAWDEVFDGYSTGSPAASRERADQDYLFHRSAAPTVRDHLLWQMNLTPFGDTDLVIATAIIDSVDESGYLASSLEEIWGGLRAVDVDLQEVEAVLHRIQNFDPPGVAARNPQECLLLQLRQLPEDTPCRQSAIRLCSEAFDLLVNQDHGRIKRLLKLNDEQLHATVKLIRSLNPHPGTLVSDTQPEYVVPDVVVRRRNGSWFVELNPAATPKIRVNRNYARLIRRSDNSDDNTYLKSHLQEARWFIKSLASRNETLLRVAQKIVEIQRPYFEHGPEAMRPLVLREVAEALEMHESTISRVTTKKYMHTPRGTLEFKYFFSSHVSTSAGGECSATAIRALIKRMIAAEAQAKPLSDNKIAAMLSEQGIQVARRTVAKYREAMGIPPSSERKRLI